MKTKYFKFSKEILIEGIDIEEAIENFQNGIDNGNFIYLDSAKEWEVGESDIEV